MINLNKKEFVKYYAIKKDLPYINQVASINHPKNLSLMFCKLYKPEYDERLLDIEDSILFVDNDADIRGKILEKNIVIYATNPRMEYVLTLNKFIKKEKRLYPEESYYVDPSAMVHHTCIIEPNVFIDTNVSIGRNCHIKSGVKIRSNVSIGDNCVIGCNTVIGDIGFGIERLNQLPWSRIPMEGDPMKMPHLGGVIIGDNVELGALNSIVSGAIDPTIVSDYVKTDDHVHIAHNCFLGRGVLITAAAELSGGVRIGRDSWIGPNCSIFQQKKIGERCVVGLGANIFKDMENDEVYIGTPSRKIKIDNKNNGK
jgi:UDP-3-O-[3-hydroxymyristoyl] glucosamine N-acyltransferase LpxD